MTQRVKSVDALRGFDMLWIMGAEGIFSALFILTQWPIFQVLDSQMQHSQWHGITAYDLIFPLFIFLSGVSIALAQQHKPQQPARHWLKPALKRLLLLMLLGVVYNHGWGQGMPANLEQIRFASVLAKIGVAWFVTFALSHYLSWRGLIAITSSILVGYWLLLSQGQVHNSNNYSLCYSVATWVDQHWLPGAHYHNLALDPEGLLATLPSIASALIGLLIGKLIVSFKQQAYKLLGYLLVIAFCLLITGYLCSSVMPLNKALWTSSFVLVSSGYCVLLLSLFYWLIDVKQYQAWCKPLLVIGCNAIAIYLSSSLFDWHYVAQSLFGGAISAMPQVAQHLCNVITLVVVQWLVLYWLYRRKILIKV